ncbi:MAG: hypothetical protein ASARMPRED_001697 [Alectoria sarmentosa]|nr:MAG: hypothetical protein ASARMPRED_001697 [Alectoria sarmentosa]
MPREIRDMIVANLLGSGDLSVLRVYKALIEEALERINQEATCQIYQGYPDHASQLIQSAFAIVEQAKFEKDGPIWFFGGRNVDPTSTCNVTIEYGKTEPGSSGLCMRNSLLRALKKFNDIKNVVVRLNKIKHGEGASNAGGHTEGKAPGEAPVASDSGISDVGIEKGTNQPGEKGDLGPKMDPIPESAKDTRGV